MPTGIVVPIAPVQPQDDGLHLRVFNLLGGPTRVEVDSNVWSSVPITVTEQVSDLTVPVPPGCSPSAARSAGSSSGAAPTWSTSGYYRRPELDCDRAERGTIGDLVVAPPTVSMVAAVRQGLGDRLEEGDSVTPLRGYMSQTMEDDPTEDPVAQVVRDGDVVAFVHVRGDAGAPAEPWTSIPFVEACGLTPEDTPGSTTTPTTVVQPTPPV